MNSLQLILPNTNQVNWGNAINNNFRILQTKYSSALLEMQKLYDRIESLDTIHISDLQFICFKKEGLETKPYIYTAGNASSLSNLWNEVVYGSTTGGAEFDPHNAGYNSYDAFYVATKSDQAEEYEQGYEWEGFTWNTGDLLIVHKQTGNVTSVAGTATTVEQWKNIMGGFYEVSEQTMSNDGKLTTKYLRKPNIVTANEKLVDTPHMYWKPTHCTTAGGDALVFTPYQISEADGEKPLAELDAISVPIGTAVWARTYVARKEHTSSDGPTFEFRVSEEFDLINNTNYNDNRKSFYIQFREASDLDGTDYDGDEIMLPYTVSFTDENQPKITVYWGNFPVGKFLYINVSVFANQEQEVRELITEILNEREAVEEENS